ncbi:hypothetical protein IW261DRAFT_1595602 [Armillaria novae-zelandiae]|uniref:Uncharacterized protein n=1 Tax=Armillaria novae-zelandiae TaxID=153914 RepID=A0AA39TA03_9AGAR|nr:hypothetical protein IW261DRAFT_1595602 [Armillaria novae-zelandiae]
MAIIELEDPVKHSPLCKSAMILPFSVQQPAPPNFGEERRKHWTNNLECPVQVLSLAPHIHATSSIYPRVVQNTSSIRVISNYPEVSPKYPGAASPLACTSPNKEHYTASGMHYYYHGITPDAHTEPRWTSDEEGVKAGAKHIEDIDKKFDILVNKFVACRALLPSLMLRQKSVVLRHVNVAQSQARVCSGNEFCWEDSSERAGTWSEQLRPDNLENSISGSVTYARERCGNGDEPRSIPCSDWTSNLFGWRFRSTVDMSKTASPSGGFSRLDAVSILLIHERNSYHTLS